MTPPLLFALAVAFAPPTGTPDPPAGASQVQKAAVLWANEITFPDPDTGEIRRTVLAREDGTPVPAPPDDDTALAASVALQRRVDAAREVWVRPTRRAVIGFGGKSVRVWQVYLLEGGGDRDGRFVNPAEPESSSG